LVAASDQSAGFLWLFEFLDGQILANRVGRNVLTLRMFFLVKQDSRSSFGLE